MKRDYHENSSQTESKQNSNHPNKESHANIEMKRWDDQKKRCKKRETRWFQQGLL